MKVARLSALCTGRLYSPGNIPGTHFCSRLSRPQGHSASGSNMSMKNSKDTIGNRNRDLPACSAVPQPTAPPRASQALNMLTLKQGHINSYNLILTSVQFPLTCVQQHLWHSTSVYRAQCMYLAARSDFQEDTTSWKRSVSRTHSIKLEIFTAYMINMSNTEHVKFCRSSNLLHNFKMSVCHVYHK